MRVISGKFKRRALAAPEGTETTRPTSDRVKESIFNIIAPYVSNSLSLDLFAGTGALGIEALSRGAQHVVFVEKNAAALNILQKNLDHVQAEKNSYTVVNADVESFLQNPQKYLARHPQGESFAASIHLIFADPPYALDWYDRAIAQFEQARVCASNCLVVLEMAHGRELLVPQDSLWHREDERKYGKTRLELWRRTSMEPEP